MTDSFTTDIFAVETPTRTAGLAVRAEAGFRFYASDHAFVGLESRNFRRLEDIQAAVRRLADATKTPVPAHRRGKRRAPRLR
jgi:hypothetical protein